MSKQRPSVKRLKKRRKALDQIKRKIKEFGVAFLKKEDLNSFLIYEGQVADVGVNDGKIAQRLVEIKAEVWKVGVDSLDEFERAFYKVHLDNKERWKHGKNN